MGTTFVSISDGDDAPGFWMADGYLEVWLRLLALHLPEPTRDGKYEATIEIRNQWLLASSAKFGGCVPHGMAEACATPEGREVVRCAIDSLLAALKKASTPIEAGTLNVRGFTGGWWNAPIERNRLQNISRAFIDLPEGRIVCTASSTKFMLGSRPDE